ncbi:MAG: metallophosphoesterase [Desulfovibrio sp.]|uniref:metallophosphoesterase n=1 Tax=Desulfovibrio sp. 7SRBS1 TaxID=3378064 RepID=UPI003B3FBB57
MSLPEERADGLLFVADPHLAGTPPGQRLPGYPRQVLHKVGQCLKIARDKNLLPVFLGDLFHWPRENPNWLLVELMDLFRPFRPYALIGNHDKFQARLTDDCSICVLEAAGVIRLLKEGGPAFRIVTPQGAAVLGASPDGTPVPESFDRSALDADDQVLWVTHHNVNFPDFPDKKVQSREIPGVDWVINGHIHRPQPTLQAGATRWSNPGNIVRLTFSSKSLERRPAIHIWRLGMEDLERVELEYLPFYDVFPQQDFPDETGGTDEQSGFLEGLQRLAWKRTREGAGLKQFLSDNLQPGLAESALVWKLYNEVIADE